MSRDDELLLIELSSMASGCICTCELVDDGPCLPCRAALWLERRAEADNARMLELCGPERAEEHRALVQRSRDRQAARRFAWRNQ